MPASAALWTIGPWETWAKGSANARQTFRRASVQVALPHSNYVPALRSQLAVVSPITLAIPLDLFGPGSAIRSRSQVSAVVPMPEAPVHEQGNSLLAPAEVGFAGERLVAPPAAKPRLAKQPRHPKLGRFVSSASHPSHEVRPAEVTESRRLRRGVTGPARHGGSTPSVTAACPRLPRTSAARLAQSCRRPGQYSRTRSRSPPETSES